MRNRVIRGARWLASRHPRTAQVARLALRRTLPWLSADAVYARWVAEHDTLGDSERRRISAAVTALPGSPGFSIVMPAYNTPPHLLEEAIASVCAQLYPMWQLCVADDGSKSVAVGEVLRRAAADDDRIRWIRLPANVGIAAASNAALTMASCEWVVLMDHDDRMPERALYELAVEVLAHPQARVIYSDEDRIEMNGRRSRPYFKPDFDPDLLLGQNLISHLGAYRRDLLTEIGGFRAGFDGSQDHDLALRATAVAGPGAVRHVPAVLYHWRLRDGRGSFSQNAEAQCSAHSRRAVAQHLAAAGSLARVEPAPTVPSFNRVVWPLPDPAPLVSVIIPTKDQPRLLEACVQGLLHRTEYPRIEILIADNGSTSPDARRLLEELANTSTLRVLTMPGPFNYADLNNRAVAAAAGDVLLLLNDDVEVIDANWLREMVSQALRPSIGAVGAKLLYPDGRLQHGGVVLGRHGVAAHWMTGASRHDPGPHGLLGLVRTVSAVTGACMALRRDLFLEIGGFDAANFAVAYNDVDLCLRIRERGYRNVWTPFAELLHRESASRGSDLSSENLARFRREEAALRRRWGSRLDHDPHVPPR